MAATESLLIRPAPAGLPSARSLAAEGVAIGRGGQATIYRLPDGRVAKVFSGHVQGSSIDLEFRAAAVARTSGVPTWRVDAVSVEGPERAIIGSFEKGRRLSNVLRRRPAAAFGLMRKLGVVHADIHRVRFETRERWRRPVRPEEAEILNSMLPPASVARARDIMRACEDGFGHGDLAPRNVLLRRGGLVVLDWGRCGRGPITADVGHTCMMVMTAPFGRFTPVALQLRYRRALIDAYVDAYVAASGRSLTEIRIWAAISLARRLARWSPPRGAEKLAGEAALWAERLRGLL